MHPLDTLALAITFCAVGLAFFIVSLTSAKILKRRHAADLADYENAHENELDALRVKLCSAYARLDREKDSQIEQQRASLQELLKSNQRLMADLRDARISALPLIDDAFTLDDRQALLTTLAQLNMARLICAQVSAEEAGKVLRAKDALQKVLSRINRHLAADGTLLILPMLTIDRDAHGWWTHPHLPLFCEGLSAQRQEQWLRTQQLDTQVVYDTRLDEHLDPDMNEGDISGFVPTAPEGDGWFLLTIKQNEDGEARAWYARRQAVALESAA